MAPRLRLCRPISQVIFRDKIFTGGLAHALYVALELLFDERELRALKNVSTVLSPKNSAAIPWGVCGFVEMVWQSDGKNGCVGGRVGAMSYL